MAIHPPARGAGRALTTARYAIATAATGAATTIAKIPGLPVKGGAGVLCRALGAAGRLLELPLARAGFAPRDRPDGPFGWLPRSPSEGYEGCPSLLRGALRSLQWLGTTRRFGGSPVRPALGAATTRSTPRRTSRTHARQLWGGRLLAAWIPARNIVKPGKPSTVPPQHFLPCGLLRSDHVLDSCCARRVDRPRVIRVRHANKA
jgi:hypothetical protein